MNALILVDLQYDFLPGGSLAVSEGDQVIPIANRLMPDFDLVVATQDWHPADHQSFASQHEGKSVGDVIQLGGQDQILWPDHCVQGTHGAELHAELDSESIDQIIQKGTNRMIDSYSGFFDNGHQQSTGLDAWLKSKNVDRVSIMGLATDYCVKFTALDAIELGFETELILEGCRGVELQPGDVERAIAELEARGVRLRR